MDGNIRQRKKDKNESDQRTNDDRDHPGRPPETSQELEHLEVKHVLILMLMVFVLFFTGTSLFLTAVRTDNILDESGPSLREALPKPFQEDNENGEKSFLAKDTLTGKKKTSKIKPLDLPTILWWTDLLYPHILSGKNVKKIQCNIGSCYSTKRKDYLSAENTRGIMFYGTDFRAYEAPLPRQKWHEWALLHEESPMNNYILSHGVMIRLFNHTSTFRRESHFPITTNSLPTLSYLTDRQSVPMSVKNKFRRESLAPIAYVQSHCNVASDRDRYVKELMKHIQVDSYGACLNNKKLPPQLQDPVQTMFNEEFYDFIARYKFHLAFENAVCDDYVTEKLFRPFHLGSVPIHMGSSTVRDWAPNNHSLILVNDFESPKDLADFIKALDKDDSEYEKYLEFKNSGIKNKLLADTMDQRNWAINEFGRHSFITAFECYVCDRIYERWHLEQRLENDPDTEVPAPRTGKYKHIGCPEPFVPVGNLKDAGPEEDIHTWIQDYWSSYDQALALQKMIHEGYSDTTKLFDVLHEMYRHKGMG